MNLGDSVRLRSVTFKSDASVRLPGTSSTAFYIPASDYPLRYFPALSLVQARCKDGTVTQPGESRTRWYHASNTRDLDVDETSLPPETAVTTTSSGHVTAPAARMKQTSGGGFERVTDESEAPLPILKEAFSDPRARMQETEEPAKKGGWPKGKPRGPRAVPQEAPVMPPVPQVRVRAERGE